MLSCTWSDECGVQGLYPVGGHNDLDIASGIKAIQLVKQLQQSPLDLPLSSWVRVIPAEDSSQPTTSTTETHHKIVAITSYTWRFIEVYKT